MHQLSHAKLAQPQKPLLQQVMISNLMLYILSVHADVTINRQGPRKAKSKKKKSSKKKSPSSQKAQSNPDGIESSGNGTSADQIPPLIVLESNGYNKGNGSNGGLVGELSEYTERRGRGSRTGSDRSSISSAGSGSSYGSSVSESDRDGSGGGLFGSKKKDRGSSTVGMVLNMFGMGVSKKTSIIGDQDKDNLPLTSLQAIH
ncbi:hypothetical protein HK100_001280 [Physocladia obscura]|uniref:Protein Zds1 C-terminal domain-containing protein n=1 Tax=Physocladia obscura TaxID=109957 RepID=A0AAD5T8B7_9FUNG|nr:hypothetical protein HK100_001280 [Physocladia obscura]